MACERGQFLQRELDEAIDARIASEESGEIQFAVIAEAEASLARTYHRRECPECRLDRRYIRSIESSRVVATNI